MTTEKARTFTHVDATGYGHAVDLLQQDLIGGNDEQRADPEWMRAKTKRARRHAERYVDIVLRAYFGRGEAANLMDVAVALGAARRALQAAPTEAARQKAEEDERQAFLRFIAAADALYEQAR